MAIELKSPFDKVKDRSGFREISDEEFAEANAEISIVMEEFSNTLRIEQAQAAKVLSELYLTF
ncbi:MAG: hypothetical protein ABIK31_01735 [candidate division WOR-3 bacterium]